MVFLSARLYRSSRWAWAKLLKFIERILDVVFQFGVSSMSFGVTVSSRHSLDITVFIYTKRDHAIYVKNLFLRLNTIVHATAVCWRAAHVFSVNSRIRGKIYFCAKQYSILLKTMQDEVALYIYFVIFFLLYNKKKIGLMSLIIFKNYCLRKD